MTSSTKPSECAAAFSAALLERGVEDERIVIVINDSAETHFATEFATRFPERVFDVGIAEQNMVGVAAGLTNAGRVPFVHSASCFLTARAMEQIKADVAYANANVALCGFVSGLAYGALGGTHHSTEDLAWMRAIPNLRVMAPATANDSAAAARALAAHEGPAFVRVISKTLVPEIFPREHEFVLDRALTVREGSEVTLIGTGLGTTRLLGAAEILTAAGIEARVVHMGTVSPIDAEAVASAAAETGRIVVAEDHVVSGGLGGAVAEAVVQSQPVPMLLLGVPDSFAPIGPAEWLHEHFGLTAERLAERITEWLG
ncbi:MAG: transketolase C-terminal domain-containing protein [Solirubrobacterales bacterium]